MLPWYLPCYFECEPNSPFAYVSSTLKYEVTYFKASISSFLKVENERIHRMAFYSWHKNAIVQFTITPGGRLSTVWAVSFLFSVLEIPSCHTAGGLEIILSDNMSGCDEYEVRCRGLIIIWYFLVPTHYDPSRQVDTTASYFLLPQCWFKSPMWLRNLSP